MTSKALEAAISKLADLFEHGHLMAETQPAQFIAEVAAEVERLRGELSVVMCDGSCEPGHCPNNIRRLTAENKRLQALYAGALKECNERIEELNDAQDKVEQLRHYGYTEVQDVIADRDS